MKPREVLNLLDQNLDDAVAKGARTVDVSALRQLIAGLRNVVEADSAQAAAEAQKRLQTRFANWLENNLQRHEGKLGALRSTILAGQSALKSCIPINGGAVVALLAFAGHMMERKVPAVSMHSLAIALAVFVGGVFSGGLASGFAYFSQWYTEDHLNGTGLTLNIAAVLSGLSSLVCFCCGGYFAYCAIAS